MSDDSEFVDYAAPIVHAALSTWSEANGQAPYPSWEDAEQWMREATFESIKFVLDQPDAPASSQHDQWVQKKLKDGWCFGPEKNPEKKTHPLLIEFDQLPEVEIKKDTLLRSLVLALYRDYGLR